MATTQNIALSAHRISISRGMTPVLAAFDLEVEKGQALVITGANGSGKTTVLRGLSGLLPLDEGEVLIHGINIQDDRQYLQEQMIYIGHKDGLSGALTIAENMKIWAASHGIDLQDQDLELAFDDLGIAPLMDIEARRLSEGQRRRGGLVRLALSQRSQARHGHHKSIWCLDEPLTAIDQDAARHLCGLIDQHTAAGGSVILSTHSALKLARMTSLELTSIYAQQDMEPGHV